MPRPATHRIRDDSTCISLDLPLDIYCISCKRKKSETIGGCKKPWDKRWLNTTKRSDYFETWKHLQAAGFKVPPVCSKERNKEKMKKANEKIKDSTPNYSTLTSCCNPSTPLPSISPDEVPRLCFEDFLVNNNSPIHSSISEKSTMKRYDCKSNFGV